MSQRWSSDDRPRGAGSYPPDEADAGNDLAADPSRVVPAESPVLPVSIASDRCMYRPIRCRSGCCSESAGLPPSCAEPDRAASRVETIAA